MVKLTIDEADQKPTKAESDHPPKFKPVSLWPLFYIDGDAIRMASEIPDKPTIVGPA